MYTSIDINPFIAFSILVIVFFYVFGRAMGPGDDE